MRLVACRLACRPRPMHFSRWGAKRPAATLRLQLGHTTCAAAAGGGACGDACHASAVRRPTPGTIRLPHLVQRDGRHYVPKHINHVAFHHGWRRRWDGGRLLAAAGP
jgi:hypothetical protein